MPTQVIMPRFGETVVDGTVSRWLKAEGERIEKMETLLEVSTDKIDSEIPSPASGVILRILVPAGKTVDAGTILAYIGQPGEEVGESGSRGAGEAALRPSVFASSSVVPAAKPSGRAFVSPVVARIAAEHDVDVDQVPGTGMGGRVTKKDILAFVEMGITEPVAPPSAPLLPRPAAPTADEILQPLSAMRRAIAAHMVQSVRTSPHVTTIFEVDMSRVVRHRAAQKAAFAEKGLSLTFTPYFVAAVAEALKAVPEANSRFSEDGVILSRRVNVGMAVSTESKGERGLIVPVIRDADEKNLMGLARTVADLAERARSGRLTPDETQGGTFTLTNHGVSGSLIGTPIINQPQCAILGIGAIVKRPVVISGSDPLLPSADDAIVIRPMCYLSLSFDHRILDGAGADAFLAKVKDLLENWKK